MGLYSLSFPVIQSTGSQGSSGQRCRSQFKKQLERDSRGRREDTQSASRHPAPSTTPDGHREGASSEQCAER